MLVSQIIDIIAFNFKILLYFNCFDEELLLVEVINNYFKDTTWSFINLLEFIRQSFRK